MKMARQNMASLSRVSSKSV